MQILNMAPSSVAKKREWFVSPWKLEKADSKHLAFVPGRSPVAGEDGDSEVLREALQVPTAVDSEEHGGDSNPNDVLEDVLEDEVLDDGLDSLALLEDKTRDVLNEMLNSQEMQVSTLVTLDRIVPVVEFGGCQIFKSTLVSQLNGNPFLSKDRLTRVRNSIYFNNSEDYISAASSSNKCLLGLGSDCGVFFLQRNTLTKSSTVKSALKRKRGRQVRNGVPSSILEGVDEGTWWVGRVQKMRRRVGTKWGMSRQPIDLMNRPVRINKKKVIFALHYGTT